MSSIQNRFYKYADLIIENIEGGYYSPTRHYTAAMGKSGETMFGMDRKWGGSVVNDSEPGKKFWAIIDKSASSWSHGYMGGSVGPELRKLAAQIMWISYDKYFKQYLSPKAQKYVSKSPRLEAHFFYACWNGVVRFQQFADAINKAVESGITNLKELENVAIQSRLNHSVSLLRVGGAKMRDKIFSKLPDGNSSLAWLWWSMGIAAVAGLGVFGYKKGWHKKIIKK